METLLYNWNVLIALIAQPMAWVAVIVCVGIGLAVRHTWLGFALGFVVFASLAASFALILSGAFLSFGEGLGAGLASFLGFFALNLLMPALAFYACVYVTARFGWRAFKQAKTGHAAQVAEASRGVQQ